MADWRKVARDENWQTSTQYVHVRLGPRKHTVKIIETDSYWQFEADIPPGLDSADLVRMLVANRTNGLAFWHFEQGHAWAVAQCPLAASPAQTALYLRAVASLADRAEVRMSETDR